MASFPYLARTTLKYKSPHATDLSFAKDETIRVTGPSEHDEDWLTGETLDGSKSGGFPKDFIVPIESDEADSAVSNQEEAPAVLTEDPPMPKAAPAPPSPKLEPAKLPPSTTASPAPASALPPATAPASTIEGEDEPAKKSMKDRLAFFAAAQNKAAPPPPIKPKPAAGGLTWSQRQKLRQEQEAKEGQAEGETTGAVETPATATAAPAPAPPAEIVTASPAATGGEEEKKAGAGLSAADAQSSIGKGGSLKERMAALRGAGAFGAPEAKVAPPSPVKPSGKVWSRPAAPEAEAGAEDGDEETDSKPSADIVEAEDDGAERAEGEDGEEPEQTEEEQEKARRAAIAARMAKLGARGPMGMAPPAPPKPVRRPTKDTEASSPTVEKSEPIPTAVSQPVMSETEEKPNEPESKPELATSPPQSVAMPAIPRRTAGPRRPARPAAAASAPKEDQSDLEKRVEKVHPDGTISPPPAVMLANEEPPLSKTDQQSEKEKEHEKAGKGEAGIEGAKAAGIALAPPSEQMEKKESSVDAGDAPPAPAAPRMVPVHPPAPSGLQATPAEHDGEDTSGAEKNLSPAQAILGLPKDEIEMKRQHDAEDSEAATEQEQGMEPAPPPPPRRISMDKPSGPRPPPSTPGKDDGANRTSLPPPPMRSAMLPSKDDEEDEENEEVRSEEEDAPPPPPRRQPSMPLPPRPVLPQEESDEEQAEAAEEEEEDEEAPPPPPPARRPTLPPPPAPEQDNYEDDEEESEPAPPPPPRREPSILPPVRTSAGGTATSVKEPIFSSPTSPEIATSPTQSKSLSLEQPQSDAPAESDPAEEDEDAARRKGIAARMAKLGGIKFGMPPPVPKVKRTNTLDHSEASSPVVPQQTVPESPMEERSVPTSPIVPTRMPPPVEAEAEQGEETPEQEAERRRKTLARLRAGGALGRGMFGQGHAAPAEDEAEVESELSEVMGKASAGQDDDGDEEDVPPPPPTARPSVPSNRPLPSAPALIEQPLKAEENDTEDAPPPPPPSTRPPVPTNRPMPAPLDTGREEEEDDAPPPPPARPSRTSTSDVPRSPIRSMSNRPALPSPSLPPPLPPVLGQEATDEPTEMAPRSPERSIRPTAVQTQTNTSENPRRSMSIASISRQSFQSTRSPASPGLGRQDSLGGLASDSGRPSFAGSRPGFNELQAASQDAGARVLRAAQGLFGQGKRAYLGDGSPAGFIMVVYEQAHLPRPEQSWGQVIYEQEAGSVLKKYDEPRPGDIAAFYDAKLKGKKGLSSYNQHVGSVEDALVGVISESEQKKHKLRVIQVERGVPEEVSYRCDDLKSGRIVVFRPGM